MTKETNCDHEAHHQGACEACLAEAYQESDKLKGDVDLLRGVALSRLERVVKWTKRANAAELQLVGIRAWARLECDKASADLIGTNPELPLASRLGGRLRLAQELAQKMDAGDFKGLPDCVSCRQGGELCGYHRAPVSEGAHSGISEKTSLPPDRIRECHCGGLKENKECPVHGWL